MTGLPIQGISLAVLLFLPAALIATRDQMWAFYLLVFCVPLHGLKLFSLVGHTFTPAEVIVLILGVHQLFEWVSNPTIQVGARRQFFLLIGFGIVCALSVAYAVFDPPTTQVFPYSRVFGFIHRPLVEFEFTKFLVSQLLLRIFFVGAVVTLVFNLSVRRVRLSIRWILIGAIATGLLGVLYQLSALTVGADAIRWVLHHQLGFVGFHSPPKTSGPLPRMYSFPGEPGFTADLLLYALGLSASLLFVGDNSVMSNHTSAITTVLLLTFLLLTTGTTGYGGLLILVVVLAVSMLAFEEFGPESLSVKTTRLLAAAGVVAAAAFVVLLPTLAPLLERTASKLMFASGSGRIRYVHMAHSIGVFLDRPVLGAGVGSHHAPSVLFTVLAETGIVGTATLFAFVGSVFRGCVGVAHRGTNRYRDLALPLFVAGTTLFLTNLVAKAMVTFLFPWFWFSLALPIALIHLSTLEQEAETQ